MEGIGALTPRQREVLALLAKGLSNREIAGVLGISGATVKTHVENVLRVLEVTNRTEAVALFVDDGKPALDAFAERPAVAVLRFGVGVEDPLAQTFASGIADDLIALLCKWRWFPVIARSTSHFYDPDQPAPRLHELTGAAYLIGGKVSRRPGQLRVDVRVDDAIRGWCLWSDHFEIPEREVFVVQEEIASIVVAQAYPELFRAEGRRARDVPPESLSAWQLAHEGAAQLGSIQEADVRRALELFARARAKDPGFVLPVYGEGMALFELVTNQWSDDIGRDLGAFERCAERAILLDERDASGWVLAGRAALAVGDPDRAIPHLERAIALNRSHDRAHSYLGQVYIMDGRREAGIDRMRLAARLNPRDSLAGLALAYFGAGEYDSAVTNYREALRLRPEVPFWRAVLSASLALGGDLGAAQAELACLRELHPGFHVATFLQLVPPGRHDVSDRIVQGLRAAGLAQ